MIVCTMATASHLFRAKVLAQSVKKHHPDARMVLCYMEKTWRPGVQTFPHFDSSVLVSGIGVPDFPRMVFTRKVNEASYALKGHFLRYLMKTSPHENKFVFLDTDTMVLGRMAELEQALRARPIVMTPHRLQDADLTHLQHGLFNIGFLALRRSEEAGRFLDWWTERTDRYCYDHQYGNGVFYEQNWLNLAPAYFDAHTLDHPGYNVAFWNLNERSSIARVAPGTYTVEGQPLRLFHFSHVGSELETSMSSHISDRRSGMYFLRNVYVKKLRKMGQRRLQTLRWSYDYYDNGKPVSQAARDAYREQPELQRRFPNPFVHSNRVLLKGTDRLRIVQVLSNFPNALPVPPTNQGGTEKITYELTEELVRRGHDVVLFAARGSRSSAKVKAYPQRLHERGLGRYIVRRLPRGVDIIHDHSFSSAVGRRLLRTPTVCTHHIPVRRPVRLPVYVSKRALQVFGAKRGMFVHNGIDPGEYQFNPEKRDYLLFIGRLLREKGILQALDVADRTGKRLLIAGPIKDNELYEKAIAPRMRANPKIEYVGAVGGQRKQDLLKHAKALLFPTIWEEPFGLVMIEAMACGTPVIALGNGAVPEVMRGFPNLICRTVDEMVDKVRHEPMPAPAVLRRYVVNRFTTEKMTDRYLEVYCQAMAGSRGKARPKAGRKGGRLAAAKSSRTPPAGVRRRRGAAVVAAKRAAPSGGAAERPVARRAAKKR